MSCGRGCDGPSAYTPVFPSEGGERKLQQLRLDSRTGASKGWVGRGHVASACLGVWSRRKPQTQPRQGDSLEGEQEQGGVFRIQALVFMYIGLFFRDNSWSSPEYLDSDKILIIKLNIANGG